MRCKIARTRYNFNMARGWESKAVEEQIDPRELEKPEAKKAEENKRKRSPEYIEMNRKKEVLRLSRARVLRQIEASQNERYTEQLNQALAELDSQIAMLDADTD